MSALGSLVVKLALEYAQFTQGLTQTEQSALQTAKKVQDTFDGMKSKLLATAGAIAGGLAASFTVNAFEKLLTGAIESGKALDSMHKQTGASVEGLTALASAGKPTSTGLDQIGASMNKLTFNLANATDESKGTGKAIEALGLNMKDFKALSPEDQMHAVAKAMAGFEDGAGKTAVAMMLFGKEGAKLLPFLSDLAEAQSLNGKMSTEQAATATDLSNNLKKLDKDYNSLKKGGDDWKNQVVGGMIPALDQASKAVLDMMGGTNGLTAEVKKLAKDGSIAEWTRSVINVFSYMIDVGEYAWRLIKSLGLSIAGMTAAVSLAISGDFRGALQAINSAGVDIKNSFSSQTIGAKFRESMEKVGKSAEDASNKIKKPGLEVDNTSGKIEKGSAAIDKQATAYRDLIAALNEKIAVDTLQLEKNGRVTEADKALLDIKKQVEKGTISQAQADSALTKEKLTQLDAVGRQIADKKRLIAAYQEEVAAEEELNAAHVAENKARDKARQAVTDYAKAIDDQNDLTQFELGLVGQTDSARQKSLEYYRLAINLKKQIDAIDSHSSEFNESQREEERARAREAHARAVAGVESQAALQEWQRVSESISGSLTDALMRGFEGGKDMASNFADTLKNMFKTLVLQPIIKAIVSPVAGVLTGALGVAGTASAGQNAAGSGLSGLLNAGSSLSALGSFGGAVSSGFGMTMAGGMGAAVEGGLAMLGSATGLSSTLAGIGQLAGALGPVALGIGALVLAVNSFKTVGEQHAGGYYSSSGKEANITNAKAVTAGGGWDDGAWARDLIDRANPAVKTLVGTTVDTVLSATNAKAKALGVNIALGIDAGLATNPNGKDKNTYGYFQIYKDGQATGENYVNRNLGTDTAAAAAQYAADMQEAAAAAVLAGTGFRNVGESAVAALDRLAGSLQGVNAVFTATGSTLMDVSLQGADAASHLVAKFGGLDGFTKSVSAYYDAFYSKQEKTVQSVNLATTAIAGLGTAVPLTNSAFKSLVQGLDLTTAAGRETYAQLVQIAPAVAQLKTASMAAIGVGADTLTGIVQGFLEGKTTAAVAGTQFGDAVSNGLKSAISAAGAAAIVDIFVGQIITPIVQSVMAGSTLQDALSSNDISGALTQARTTASVYAAVLNDPAIKGMGTMLAQAFGLAASGATDAADTIKDAGAVIRGGADEATNPVNTLAASTAALGDAALGAQSAAEAAAASLNAIPKDIQINVAVNVAGANAQGVPSAGMPAGMPHVPSDMRSENMAIDNASADAMRKYDSINVAAAMPSAAAMMIDASASVAGNMDTTKIVDPLKEIVDATNLTASRLNDLREDFKRNNITGKYDAVYLNKLDEIRAPIAGTNPRDFGAGSAKIVNAFGFSDNPDAATAAYGQYGGFVTGSATLGQLSNAINSRGSVTYEDLRKILGINDASIFMGKDTKFTDTVNSDTIKQVISYELGYLKTSLTTILDENGQVMTDAWGTMQQIARDANGNTIFSAANPTQQATDVLKGLGVNSIDELLNKPMSEFGKIMENANWESFIKLFENGAKEIASITGDTTKLDVFNKFKDGLTALNKEMDAKAVDILKPLKDELSAVGKLQNPFSDITARQADYLEQLNSIGRATTENNALVNQWAEALKDVKRKVLYSQLLSPEELKQSKVADVAKDFATLGQTMPINVQGLRAMIDAAKAAGNTTLRDGLLSLVPAFVSLQGAASAAAETIEQAYNRLHGVTKTNEQIAQEKIGLEDRLFAATASQAQIASHARDAIADYNKTLYDQVVAAERAKAVSAERAGLEQQLNQALGNTTALRALELEKLDASNVALQKRLWAIEDASKNVDGALSSVQRAIGAEKTAVQSSADARIAAIRKSMDASKSAQDAAQKSVDTLKGVFDDIGTAVKSLRDQVSDPASSMVQSRAYIDMALSLARAGTMPDAQKLRDAIGVVTKDSTDMYASREDYMRAQLVQAGKLEQLGVYADTQKTVAQQQLEKLSSANTLAESQIKAIEEATKSQLSVLDQQLQAAQDAVSVMRGVDISVQSVATAITGLNAALAGYAAATGTHGQVVGGGAPGGPATSVVTNPSSGGGGTVTTPSGQYTTAFGVTIDASALALPAGLLEQASNASGNLASVRDYAVAHGLTSSDVATAYQSLGYSNTDKQDILSWAANNGLPAFATGGMHSGGLRLVGENGPEIEATGPARIFNATDTQRILNGGGTQNTQRLEQLVAELIAQNQRLEGKLAAIAENTGDTHDLLYNVTEGGDAMRHVAA